jgi:tol-pal system protein YbgF
MKLFSLLCLAILCGHGAFAADKSILELQRDMALLQDQMRSLEEKIATLQTAVQQIAQQTADSGARSDARIDKFQAAMEQAIKSEVSQLAAPIAGVGTKLDGVSGEISTLRDASGETTRQMTALRSQMDEMNNVLKALQTPAPAPASSSTDSQQMVPSSKMFNDAAADMNGKQDLALIEFGDFLRLFPNDPMAPQAQFNIGQIHYGQSLFEQAAKDFDTVAANYPTSQQVPDAMYMGGLAVMKTGNREAAADVFRALVKQYPHSSQASQARDLLRALTPH